MRLLAFASLFALFAFSRGDRRSKSPQKNSFTTLFFQGHAKEATHRLSPDRPIRLVEFRHDLDDVQLGGKGDVVTTIDGDQILSATP